MADRFHLLTNVREAVEKILSRIGPDIRAAHASVSVPAISAPVPTDVAVRWVGGAVLSHTLARAVRRYDRRSDYSRLTARLRELCGGRRTAAAIAGRLNAEGFRPPKRMARFTRDMVLRLVGQLGLGCRPPHGSPTGWGPDEYRPAGLAGRLGINPDTVRRWVRVGWVHVRRDADRHHVIWADASELSRLRELHQLPRTWANKGRLAELTKPKPRPAR